MKPAGPTPSPTSIVPPMPVLLPSLPAARRLAGGLLLPTLGLLMAAPAPARPADGPLAGTWPTPQPRWPTAP
ncbi:MAG: hypothetical protein WKG07_05695 [Hymenobacter sp.]